MCVVSPGDDVYRSIPSRKMLFERLLRGTRCTRGDGNPRSAGADYIGALDSACLEGDSADTVQGARPAAARPARDAAAACSDGQCANASMPHYATPRPALKNSPILPMRPTAWMAAGILQFGTGQHAPDGATAQAKPPRAQASGNAARVPMRAAPCRATHPRGNPGQAARGATAGRHTSAGVSYTGRASSSLNVTPRKGASPQLRTGAWGRRTPARRLAGARAQGAPDDEAFFRARGHARSTLAESAA